jgi:hypothetical protein
MQHGGRELVDGIGGNSSLTAISRGFSWLEFPVPTARWRRRVKLCISSGIVRPGVGIINKLAATVVHPGGLATGYFGRAGRGL